MADLYTILGAVTTQRLQNGTQLVDVVEASGITHPHEISFTVSVDKVPGWRDALLAAAADEAREMESLFGA